MNEFVEICKCAGCEKDIEVSFIVKPTKEDKLGWYCDKCASDKGEEEE